MQIKKKILIIFLIDMLHFSSKKLILFKEFYSYISFNSQTKRKIINEWKIRITYIDIALNFFMTYSNFKKYYYYCNVYQCNFIIYCFITIFLNKRFSLIFLWLILFLFYKNIFLWERTFVTKVSSLKMFIFYELRFLQV